MNKNKRFKPNALPAVLLCILSVLLLAIVGCIVYLQVKPLHRNDQIEGIVSPMPTVTADPVPAVDTPAPTIPVGFVDAAETTAKPIHQIETFSDRFWQDGILISENEYKSPDLSILYRCVYDTETFGKRVTYYTAEIFVDDVTKIKTASCKGDFHKIGHGSAEKIAIENHALVAISGDYYGFHGDSLVIRNGIVYRTTLRKGDICLLLRDGTMETIRGADANIDRILEKDSWQGWQFGPSLLTESGEAKSGFPDSKLSVANPRSCIGYVEPGHYFFVVVDGRQKNSKGLTLTELAQLMESLGCVLAFNLDGGASAHFFWDDRIVSNPCGGGRQISDIIYIEKESYPDSAHFAHQKGIIE